MPYTLNPANSNGVNEVATMANFNRNRGAIEAYQRSRGGALEDAYRAVTGQPWPEGRSVKISNGVAEMTKDRTVKSVLGKYVAPIAAGAATAGFAIPAIAGGGAAAGGLGGAAGGAAGAGSGAAAGATALGAIGAAGVPSMPWTLGAGAEGLLASGPVAGAAGATIPSAVGTTVAGNVAPYGGNLTVNGTQVGGGGFWGGLARGIGKVFGGGGGQGQGTNYGGAAVNTGLNLLGSYLSSRAANQAADQMMEYGNKALDFEKQRYGDAQGNFAPFIASGTQANQTMAQALMPSNGPAPTAANLAPQFTNAFYQAAQNNGQRTVQMRAPTGEIRAVQDFQVPGFMAKGAEIVG